MNNLLKYLSVFTALCLVSLFSVSLNAQIPEPYLYYDFEDAAGSSTVTDSSGNDREGTVSGNIEFGAEGAPSGSTPAAAGQFSVGGTGYVTVEGSDAPTDFGNRDQGIAASYTMACWINPDQASFSGDRFIFGQGSQGIHHGFRGGNLYHAHWGSDFSGQSALSPDEWVHIAFTYDSEISSGVIYVNGEFDTEMTGQQGPNGGGPLVIGARNGGGENYVGLIDDLAVWQEVLSEDQIAALADGLNPAGRDNNDDDEDGLPDYYEEKLVDNLDDLNGNAAGPGPGAGTGDFDGDGLTDLDEYEETKTDPTKADTDEDGLSDAVETNTGTYVSATNTGTNPRKADSDSDGLLDGVETNTGILVDEEEDTGTDPNNADTDGDGYSDSGEIAGGTDPHDPNSKGAIPAPFLYLDFEDGAIDLSGNANDGEVNGDVTFDAEGAEGGPTPTTGASFNGGHLNIPGVDMSGIIQDIQGENSYTLSAWIKPSDLGGNKFLWGQTSQGIHNGIRNGGFLHQAHWGADTNGATNLSTLEGQWIHAAWVYDGDADVGTIYLNGEVDWTGGKRAPNGSGNLLVGGSNGGGDNYRGLVDDVAVWNEALPDGTIQSLADGISPIGASQEDEDGDGLPDAWEEKYGVDDPEGDDDNDGLTNIEEYEARTKPNKADSDEDGLSDKAEIEVHKTNPLNPDADRDGLLDGAEIAAGTDPDNRDTDGDGISDFNEIQDGTDPLVVTAIAFETNLVSYWPLDSDFDDAQAENHGVEEGGPIEFQTGKFDGSVYLNGSQSIEITGDENTFDFAGESFTVSAWYTAEAINKSWQCLVAKGEGNGWRVHRRGGDNPPEMTFTGGNGDVDRHNVAMTVGGDPETWHHVAGVTDADTQEEILYLDGEEVARKAGATLQDRGNPMRIGDNPDARNRNWQGKVDDVAVWGRALQPNEIAEIWDGGSGKSIEDMLGLSVPFDFTSVIYDAEEDSFRFEWNSKPNRTYALYFSETLEEFDADVDDSIESGGETTVYPPIGEPGLENPLEGAPQLFFRIEENQ